MGNFISGLELSKRFFFEVVKPILDQEMPNLNYSAGLIGYGSEVLGFDTEVSTDHHWGPRFLMFLPENGFDDQRNKIDNLLSQKLPYEFLGYTTNYTEGDEIGIRRSAPKTVGPIDHFVEFYSISSYLKKRLNIKSTKSLTGIEWKELAEKYEQNLLETVSGEVFIDKLDTLEEMRRDLKYYPDDVWLYLMASQWDELGQIEAFVGRCGDVGDELGSRLIAADIIKIIMNLCFLMEKKYRPYPKWFGSGFKKLTVVNFLLPIFVDILNAQKWKEREIYLSKAYKKITQMHNALGITEKMPEEVETYYGRPYKVIRADRFAAHIIDKSSFSLDK